MKDKNVKIILRLLFTLLGAGVGVALMMGAVQIFRVVDRTIQIPVYAVALSYTGSGILFGLIFLLVSSPFAEKTIALTKCCEEKIESMSLMQLLSSMLGLIVGLVISVLMIQVVRFLGNSIFTVALSSIIFVVLGSVGFSVGLKKSPEFAEIMGEMGKGEGKKFRAKTAPKHAHPVKAYIIDMSAVIDGRAEALTRIGALADAVLVPSFVMEGLEEMASSSDAVKAAQGRSGMNLAEKMIDEGLWHQVTVKGAIDEETMLLNLARERNGKIVTVSRQLTDKCADRKIPCVNLNLLAEAMRETAKAGTVLTIALVKKGKDPSQGVGYMTDGTMVVVKNAGSKIGSTVQVKVSSVLQTSAGRMVFADIQEYSLK